MDAENKKWLSVVVDFLLFYVLGFALMTFLWGGLDQYTTFNLEDFALSEPTNWIFLLTFLGFPLVMGLGMATLDIRKWEHGQKIKAKDGRGN